MKNNISRCGNPQFTSFILFQSRKKEKNTIIFKTTLLQSNVHLNGFLLPNIKIYS